MSVTIKPNKMKYKNSSGNYVGINAIAEQTTAEEIADIQAASTAAQGEITALTTAKKTEIDNKAAEVTSQLANAAEVRNMLAGTFSTSTNYKKGQYVIQTVTVSGSSVNKLYRFTADHPAGNWLGTDVVEVKLADDVNSLSSAKADKDGAYEDLTAGNADYLLSDRGETDVAPYVFRKTGGAKNGFGRELLRKIVGGTVAWNQLVPNGNFSDATGWSVFGGSQYGSLSVLNNIATVTYNKAGSASYNYALTRSVPKLLTTHKYFIDFSANPSININLNIDNVNENYSRQFTANTWGKYQRILSPDTQIEVLFIKPYNTTLAVNDTVQIKNVNVFDLTQMFGSTIADAIYAMEQATAGSGVAWFRSLFPNSYYAYDAGSLQSVQAKEHRLTGFNQWDEQWEVTTYQGMNSVWTKNYVPVMPNTEYCINMGHSVYTIKICQFDANKNLISAEDKSLTNHIRLITTSGNCHYLKIGFNANYGSVYVNDVCINLSDSSRNGQYKPYESNTYPLDSSLTLRGIPKWDSTNGLYYDGDEYTPDGSVKRKYGIVDLGSITWSYMSDTGCLVSRSFSNEGLPVGKSGSVGGLNNVVCDKYVAKATRGYASSYSDKLCGLSVDGSQLIVKDSAYSDAAAFKTDMSGVYLVYELATPTTEQADPYRELQISAHGGTEEFVDAGVTATTPTRDVSVPVGTETFYPIDVVAYIEELTNPDHDMVADALIPSGKYFMVGNSLYKSTSQIQAGATIIPGSNCTAKTLAEALNELNT